MIATIKPQQQEEAYQCSHCNMIFSKEEFYKMHYKSDLHKYNLKRRLLELNPITEEQFNLQFNRDQSETSVHSNLLYCIPCGKSFGKRKTLNQHLESKKHMLKVQMSNQAWKNNQHHMKDSESDTSASKMMEKRYTNEDCTVCLFCDHKSQTLNINMDHMQNNHGFFPASQEYLNNVKGLVKCLGQKINEDKQCIKCLQEFKSCEGVKQHMLDKQHCVMQTLSVQESEYLIFYDFTKPQKIDEVENEEDNQSISEWEEIGGNEQQNNQQQQNQENLEEEKKAEFVNYLNSLKQDVKITELGEVQLANGKILGHRQYKKYYHIYYRDFEEYVRRQNQKMLENTDQSFKMRQITQGAQDELTDEQKEEIKKSQKMLKKERKQVAQNPDMKAPKHIVLNRGKNAE